MGSTAPEAEDLEEQQVLAEPAVQQEPILLVPEVRRGNLPRPPVLEEHFLMHQFLLTEEIQE